MSENLQQSETCCAQR